jgi:hypothetical protein
VPIEPSVETPLDTFVEEPPAAAVPEIAPAPELAMPEPDFAARVPPPEPERPLPSRRRAIYFDVENSSRVEHVARVLAHLRIEHLSRTTDLIAVGNWRVINHDTARVLAQHGANLVHSAPSTGVRDWSDLRIAVSAGVWLAAARAGDVIEIVSDDQAFDAVGDVAQSLGVEFHRLSYRMLSGAVAELPREEPAEPRGRRRRRGGRRGRRPAPVVEMPVRSDTNGTPPEPAGEGHTAPHDELLAVARELLARASEGAVSIDALSNALKAHGFRRTPGSPRLITRLRRIKELEVGRNGSIRLTAGEAGSGGTPALVVGEGGGPSEGPPLPADAGTGETVPPAAPARRRRRRGGRRRRGRGGGQPAIVAP